MNETGTYKILIVGCGGIGSFLARELNRLILNGQITEKTEITLADFDIVELKNIKYQNFTTNDLNRNKAEKLGDKYLFDYIKTEIKTEKELEPYNFIVSCVDNVETRKLFLNDCSKTGKYFIDLRAEGRAIAIFTKTDTSNKEELLKTLTGDGKSHSCQLDYELEQGIIQNGNVITALIGSQLILNKLREEKNNERYMFYF